MATVTETILALHTDVLDAAFDAYRDRDADWDARLLRYVDAHRKLAAAVEDLERRAIEAERRAKMLEASAPLAISLAKE